jgi:molybdate transport system substrate-binding protein
VWYTECYYQQQQLGNPVETVAIPDKENITANYVAGVLKAAPHAQAVRVNFSAPAARCKR